jgi:hypothetical protein
MIKSIFLLLYFSFKENPFKQELRQYPVDLGILQNKLNITIEIPDGYAVETIPEGLNIVDGIGTFKYIIGNNPGVKYKLL